MTTDLWTLGSSPPIPENGWSSVAYGNGIFVAVDLGGIVIKSLDGETWTVVSSSDDNWSSVTYGNGIFVVIAWEGGGMTSPDGDTWTLISTPDNNWSSIPISNVCFPSGTPIVTNQGIIDIDLIDTNVHTICEKKIIAITKTITYDKYLVCFDKNAIGNNVPSHQTIISQNHQIFYKGKMVNSNELLRKSKGVKKVKYTGEVLYNVLLENHETMVVNNLICETLNPENYIAKLYTLLNKTTSKEHRTIIQFYNNIFHKNISKIQSFKNK